MTRNTFFTFAGIVVGLLTTVCNVLAATYYVNATIGASDSNDGTIVSPWRSISHAISHVPEGTANNPTIIYIGPGTYDTAHGESFPIDIQDEYLHLIGTTGAPYPEVNAGSRSTVALAVNVGNVMVSGLSFQNASAGINFYDGNVVIKDNVFEDSLNEAGILIDRERLNQSTSQDYGTISITGNSFAGDASDSSYVGVSLKNYVEFDAVTPDLSISFGDITIDNNTFVLQSGHSGVKTPNSGALGTRNLGRNGEVTIGGVFIRNNTFSGGDSGIIFTSWQARNITATAGVTIGDLQISDNSFTNHESIAIIADHTILSNLTESGTITTGEIRIERNMVNSSSFLGVPGISVRIDDFTTYTGSVSVSSGNVVVADNEVNTTSTGLKLSIEGPNTLGEASGTHTNTVSLGNITVQGNTVVTSGRAFDITINNFLYECYGDTRSSLGTLLVKGNSLVGNRSIFLRFEESGYESYGNSRADLGTITFDDNIIRSTNGHGLDIYATNFPYEYMGDNSFLGFSPIVVKNNTIKTGGTDKHGINFELYDNGSGLSENATAVMGGFQVTNNVFNPDKTTGMAKGIFYENKKAFRYACDQSQMSFDPILISGNSFHKLTAQAIHLTQSSIDPLCSSGDTPVLTLADVEVSNNQIDGATIGVLRQFGDIEHEWGSLNLGSTLITANTLQDISGDGGFAITAQQITNNAPSTATISMGENTISGNSLLNGGAAAISLSLTPLAEPGTHVAEQIISENTILDYRYGILLDDTVVPTSIFCNTIQNMTETGLRVEGTHNGTITAKRNNLVGNALYGLRVLDSSNGVVNAKNNWWGDNVGPMACSGCNTIYQGGGSVTFEPWLSAMIKEGQCQDFSWLLFMPAILGTAKH